MKKEGPMRKKAIETVSGICLLISGMFIPMKNVEAFDTYTASLAESESDTSDDWYNETMNRILGDIRDPYGFYYTTPGCEETDLYYGSGLGDTLYICIYPGESNSIFVSMQSLLGDDLYASNEHPVELYFDSDQEKWVDDNGAFLAFDENNNRFIYSDSSIQICLENFTVSSAWEGPTHLWGDIHPEGEYIADDGTTITVIDLYNKFYDIILSDDIMLMAEMNFETDDTYDIYQSVRIKVLEMTCSDVTDDTVDTLTFTDPDTGDYQIFHKNSSAYDLYLRAADFSGKYKITGGLAGDDSYITMEYNPDGRYYTYKFIWQGKELVELGTAFPSNVSEIQSETFCMSLAPYINGEEEYIETFIPRFGDYFYLYPEE